MKYRLLIVLLLSAETLWSQSSSLYPYSFVWFSDNYSFDNPAASSFHHPRDLKLINSFYTGLLKNVGLYYLDISITTGKKNKAHTPGLVIYTEYETELLKRSRVYFRYAWQTSLSQNLRLSAGLSFGFFNYSVRGTNSSAGSSVFAPDGIAGLWLHGKSFNAGISFNQFTGAAVKPVNRMFILGPYLTLLSNYRFTISQELELLIALRGYIGEENYAGGSAGTNIIVSEHFTAGLVYHYKHGAGFNVGINKFHLLSLFGDLSFTYFQPTSSLDVLNSNRIEIMLRAYLKE